MYIGVDNSGSPLGLSDVDSELLKLTSMINDCIRPDVIMMVSSDVTLIGRVPVIVVKVERGFNRPYYLAKKGLRPEGVYIRNGAANIPTSNTAILRMIKETDGDTYESRISLNQNLSFDYAAKVFQKKKIPFGSEQMRTLGMLDEGGLYTNLGLLLSDQCPPYIKAALFADDERSVFMVREEYEGSILAQLNDAYAFLEYNNRYKTIYEGLERVDYGDYPPVVLREALVNSVAHREFSLSGPTLVSILPSRVEIVSLGGLPVGLEYEDLNACISMPRNRLLASILFRLEIIEAYGTGIGRMRESYASRQFMSEKDKLDITIKVTPNTFMVVLPNRNKENILRDENPVALDAEKYVQDLLKDGPKSRKEIQDKLKVSQTATIRLLSKLVEGNVITKIGQGKSTRYTAVDKTVLL